MTASALADFFNLHPHERKLNNFILREPLGRGGSASVWLADEVLNGRTIRQVAVKLFQLDDERASRRSGDTSHTQGTRKPPEQLIEEARALCRVEHPNVVRYHTFVKDEKQKLIGLVMEYVDGTPLDKVIHGSGGPPHPLDVNEVLAVSLAISSALSAVHRVGLVHRDIKPSNVIVSQDVYKVIDFGIAATERPRLRAVSDAESQIVADHLVLEAPIEPQDVTHEQVIGDAHMASVGTLGYMDPECVGTGEPATPASDLYSLGATLFECLTGHAPARAANHARGEAGLSNAVLCGKVRAPSLQEFAPNAPQGLVRLIDSLLDPDRAKRPRSAEIVAWSIERLRGMIARQERSLPPEHEGPFRGLGRFEEKDRDVFFGRSTELAVTIELLRSHGLVALIGASGSGKSSLARAGVLPAIAEGALGRWPKKWVRVIVSPGEDPAATLLGALEAHVPSAAGGSIEELIAALIMHAEEHGQGLVLLVDQLEELVTRANPESARRAVEILTRLGEQATPGLRTVVTVRQDLVQHLLSRAPELSKVLTRDAMFVPPLGKAAWEESLDQALAAYGYSFEDEELRAKVWSKLEDKATAMPLVAFALRKLWEERDTQRKRLTHAGLDRIQGIHGALTQHADATLHDIETMHPDAREVARATLLSLTTPQRTRAFRDIATLRDAVNRDLVEKVVEELEKARLVMKEEHGYTITHEMLITEWGQLRSWVEEVSNDRKLAEKLNRAASDWKETARDPSLLWRGAQLTVAEATRDRKAVDLGEDALLFLRESRSSERRRKGSLWVSVMLVLALVGAGITVAFYLIDAERRVAEESAAAAQKAQRDARDAEQKALEERDNAKRSANAEQQAAAEAQRARERAEAAERKFKQDLDKLHGELRRNIDNIEGLNALARKVAGQDGASVNRGRESRVLIAP